MEGDAAHGPAAPLKSPGNAVPAVLSTPEGGADEGSCPCQVSLGELSPRTRQGATPRCLSVRPLCPPSAHPFPSQAVHRLSEQGDEFSSPGQKSTPFSSVSVFSCLATGQSPGLQLGPREPSPSIPGRDHDPLPAAQAARVLRACV